MLPAMFSYVQSKPMARIFLNPILLVFVLAMSLLYLMRESVPHVSHPRTWLEYAHQHKVSEASDSSLHPVRVLFEDASKAFAHMRERQSSTLDQATTEYVRRYQRSPPPGFDKWFKYAQTHNSMIIDEFDMIHEALEPFWQLEPKDIRSMIDQAGQKDVRLWNFTIAEGQFQIPDDDWMAERMKDFLGEVVAEIPDMTAIVNPLDEPRVVTQQAGSTNVKFTDAGQKPSWRIITRECGWTSGTSNKSISVNLHGLPFVKDVHQATDLCQNSDYKDIHGFFMAPATFIYTKQLLPVFSQSKPSTFGDIVYPSMWYWDHEDEELEAHDPEWKDKKNNFYWAGSTTGGFSADDAAMQHRQRFVHFARHLGNTTATFLTESKAGGSWESYQSAEILSQLYDAKFTNVVQCAEEECEVFKEYFQVGEHEDGATQYKSRFVMDLDGNSFSGRYYNLLGSRSTVMKQTIFREWHDERLVPWVHYVPVSLQMDELPEIMRYLALTEEGSKIAQTIGQNGKEWNAQVLRREDAAIYLYRLFLEYARILDDNRDNTRIGLP